MPVTTSWNYRADETPALVVPPALLDPGSNNPVPTSFAYLISGQSGNAQGLLTKFNRNAVRGDLLGRYGGGGYACCPYGLELQPLSGLNFQVTAGQAMLDGPVTLAAAVTKAATDEIARGYTWFTNAATVQVVNNDPTAPGAYCTYLGSVKTTGGAVTEIDYSGRLFLRGGTLWRRTADLGVPTDSPPSGLQFMQRSRNGLFWWDGFEYHGVRDRSLVTLRQQAVTIPAYAGNYQLEADFSAVGVFGNPCYAVSCTSDETGIIISEELNRKAAGRLSLVVYVGSDAAAGSYGGALDLLLSVTLEGAGWTGAAPSDVAAAWSEPQLIA